MELVGRDAGGTVLRVRIADGLIEAVEPLGGEPSSATHTGAAGASLTDGGLPLLLPGLVDLQVNGFAGHDVNAEDVDAATIEALCATLLAEGTTAFLPTVITGSPERLVQTLRAVREAVEAGGLASEMVLGAHVEGPYLSERDGTRGAHDPAWIRDPDAAELAAWRAAVGDLPLLVTLAPERPGAADFVRSAVAVGVRVAIGHCMPTVAECAVAVDAGARYATHLGNGLPALIPRHPNHLWYLLADDRVRVGLIADGDHLPVETLVAMIRAKGTGRSFLVSDSAALAHCPPGEYESLVGGLVVVEESGRLGMAGTPYLAGSGHSLRECLDWAWGHVPLAPADLVAMCTATPASEIGAADRGRLVPGARADLLVVAPDGEAEVLLRGVPRGPAGTFRHAPGP